MRKVAISIMFLIQSCIPSHSNSPIEIDYGKWNLFIGYKNQLPHCIMTTRQDGMVMSIMYTINYVAGNWVRNYIIEHSFDRASNLPNGISIDFIFLGDSVQIDGHNNGGKIIIIDNDGKIDELLNSFFRYSLMGINFHNTSIPKKQVDIGGSINMKRSFEFCIGIVNEYGNRVLVSPEMHLKNLMIDASRGDLIHKYKE